MHARTQSKVITIPPGGGNNQYDIYHNTKLYYDIYQYCFESQTPVRKETPEVNMFKYLCLFRNNASEAVTICKEEGDPGHLGQSSSLHEGFLSRHSHHLLSVRRHHPKQSSTDARTQDSISEGTSALFASGICRWPGCDAVFQHLPSFLEHLHSEHSHGDRSIAEWRIQHEKVQHMENQLILEKQKLTAMQYHLHHSEQRLTALKASEAPYSLPLFLHQPKIAQEDNLQQWGLKHLDEGYRTVGSAHLISVPSIECYKYNNIRPPHTYAFLIRWSILESPDKQRTLNEIYNWFTTMFFYFRHNTATWKNAVRHNLSLHKCFVRVEGGKGAVWTVDETEYQRRKGQKYYRYSLGPLL
uniref:Forkhead box protein P1-B-like n=1 Tax=Sphaeramia orbicularis TaxID=375764 RepID=A0A672ZPD0_9TELE